MMSHPIIYLALGAILLILLLGLFLRKPTQVANWSKDQATLPYAEISEQEISLHNIRSNVYRSTTDYDVKHYDRKIRIDDIQTVDFIVEPFSGHKVVAHTLLSFGLSDGTYLSISIEVRKQVGQSFSAFKGLFRHFQIMYVLADETDVVKLRSNFRKDEVFLFPMQTTRERAQLLFVDMIKRMNGLHERPEFYNTIWNTCTTNLIDHVNHIFPNRIPWDYSKYLPGKTAELGYEIGLVKSDKPYEQIKKESLITERANQYQDGENFSQWIRAR